MATTKKVKFLKAPAAYKLAYHPGQTAELTAALATELIENGYAEEVKAPSGASLRAESRSEKPKKKTTKK